ncbi:MAG: ECF RNA polymerase sigma factor SigK [Actinobacteria bacterium]|nr:ECF RNA polymerase sigma factor SigK [Actinomycetota bacterium]
MTEEVGGLRRLHAVPNPTTNDDVDQLAAALVSCGRGDQQAFSTIYDRLAPLVHGIVLRIVRDPAQAEEVTQEVFVELWRIAPRYDAGKGSAKVWAATIAHRRAVDRVRSEQSARDRVDRAGAHRPIAPDPVAETVESSFEQLRVRKALNQLTSAQREAVELAYFGGHTYREVATLLDVAEGTIKSRIRDGMIRLRDELGASEAS